MTRSVPAPTDLVAGKLRVVGGVIPLDGRVSWVPREARGFQPANCYVLVDEPMAKGASVFLVDPGPAFHEDLVTEQLRAMLPEDVELSIYLSRFETDVMSSFGAIAEAFPIKTYYGGGSPNPFDAFDSAGLLDRRERASYVPLARVQPGYVIPVGPGRTFELVHPMSLIRLLVTYWGYDAATKTLFTSDLFTHNIAARADAPRILDTPRDGTATVDSVRAHLLAKFWWLPHVDAGMNEIKDSLRAVFERYDVEIIAPNYGAIMRGKDTVRAHLDLLMHVLDGFAS